MSIERKWKLVVWDECPECGCGAEVFTDADENYAYDGDDARCDGQCGNVGSVTVDGEANAYVNWDNGDEWADQGDRHE